MTIRFTPLTHEDLVQLHLWLQRPHVARWWRDLETYEKVVADHLPALEGREPTDHYLIVVDDRPIGMIQAYLVADHPEWDAILELGEGVAGVDLFITNDTRLHSKQISGIQFIVPIDRTPI